MESEDNLDKKVNLPRNSLDLRGGGSDAKLTVGLLFQVKKVHKEIWSLLQEIQVRKDRKVYLESLDQKVRQTKVSIYVLVTNPESFI